MIEKKIGENKTSIFLAIFALVFAVLAIIYIKFFYLSDNELRFTGSDVQATVGIKKINIEKLDTRLLSSEKFKSFKDKSYQKSVNLKAGKDNPFTPTEE